MFPLSYARHNAVVVALLVLAGCSLSPVPKPTDPSGVTQQLMMRSLEHLNIERLKEQAVSIEIINQAGPPVMIKEFMTAWFRAHGVRIVEDYPT